MIFPKVANIVASDDDVVAMLIISESFESL